MGIGKIILGYFDKMAVIKDGGFRLITNRTLYETKMTDDIEQIKKIA